MKSTLLLLILMTLLCGNDTLRITFGHKTGSAMHEFGQRFTEEINRQLDSTLTLEIYYKPHGRSLLNLCEGSIDGDFFRIEEAYSHCPTVVKVPVVLLSDTHYTYCLTAYHKLVKEHPDTTTRYVSVLGSRAVLLWREKHNVPVHEVHTYAQALQMISLGRVDCLIGSSVYEADTLFKTYNIQRSSEPLFTSNYYLFLNKKHEQHVGQLTKVLYNLSESGYLGRLLRGEVE